MHREKPQEMVFAWLCNSDTALNDWGRSQNDHADNSHSLDPPSDKSQKEQDNLYEQEDVWT